MENKKLIGFLDSGVGGISVLACAKRLIHNADYIYYADTDNVPYGTKTRGEIIHCVDDAMKCLISRGADAVVIACNTATSIAVDLMREKYDLPIIGMEPALKPAVKRHTDGKILVCATPVTVAGERLRSLIELTGATPDLYALPELVTFAENGIFDKETVCRYLNDTISDPEKYDAVVLGCTHFTYFRDSFTETFRNAEIIDGNLGAVKRLAALTGAELDASDALSETETTYIRSGREVTDQEDLECLRSYERRMAEYYNDII